MKKVEMNFDGQKLEGFSSTDHDNLVLHIHGSWGNYNGNPFVEYVAKTYNSLGWRYASTNNPGCNEGTIHEDFSISCDAIAQWVSELAPRNTPIILQGHSLGALKILFMVNNTRYAEIVKRIAGIVLLSPFDLVAFYGGQNVERRRNHAKEFRDENGERAVLPHSIFDIWEISAGTFLELSEQGGPYDGFPTREKSIGYLAKVTIPTLVVIGGQDSASYPSPLAVTELLENKSINHVFLEEAPHNFAGSEDELAEAIADFVSTISL